MTEILCSDVMKKQNELAWQYLEKARPLITYEKLVPVSETQIEQYELQWDKNVPPDYRYWLTTYGSGRIEFLEGALSIVSIYELMESDGRSVSDDDPQHCWKRIYIGYAGAPVALSLDSTIIDDHGCAPVIHTESYSNKVEKVLASSWPMYLIKRIIAIASGMKERGQSGVYTAEQLSVIEELANQNMESIDDAMGMASERAYAHNRTKRETSDGAVDNAELLNSMLDFFEGCKEERKSEGIVSRLLSTIHDLFGDEDEFDKVVGELEDHIAKGYASLVDNSFFFSNEVEPRHAQGVKELLCHERREVCELAKRAWLRLNPGEAEKLAVRMWDWLKCAEDWMAVDKSGKEAVRCLREAEHAATDFTEWKACANFWLEKLQNVSESRRCLLIAEENIANSDLPLSVNLILLSMSWVKLNESELAKRNLLLIEETPEDWDALVRASQIWREDLKEFESAKRCLGKAELLAFNDPFALGSIRSEWELIGDE